MKYRLLYDTGQGLVDLDLGDETPAMTYQVNNLAELKDRQASYSMAMKLPKTPRNLRTLGFIDDFGVVADAAYTPRRCELFCDGALLSPFGAMLYVDSVEARNGGGISCQIVSASSDLFATLASVDRDNMVDEAWERVWTSDQIARDNADSAGACRWPLVVTHTGVGQEYRPPVIGGRVAMELLEMVPCYHLNTLVREVFAKFWFDVESDLFTDKTADGIYISASDIQSPGSPITHFAATGIRLPLPTGGAGAGSGIYPTITQADQYAWEDSEPKPLPGARRATAYRASQPGAYVISIEVENVGTTEVGDGTRGLLEYAIYRNRMLMSSGTLPMLDPGARINLTAGMESIDMNVGDVLRFVIAPNESTRYMGIVNISGEIALEGSNEAAPGPGASFGIVQSLGFGNYRDIVSAYLQLFGAMVDVKYRLPAGEEENTRIGVVRIYTFRELYRRRDAGQFVDWSGKLAIDRDQTIGFSVANYAQRNTIRMTENTDDRTSDEFVFAVENKTLETSKDLFTIQIEAGRNLFFQGGLGPNLWAVVPTLEREVEEVQDGETPTADTGVTLKYKGCGPHLLTLGGIYTVVNRVADITPPLRLRLPVSVTQKFSSLAKVYYTPIAEMLKHAKTLSAYFILTPADIEQLDFFTPVWIERYGAYFFINKINNFVAGKPTRVELVKM